MQANLDGFKAHFANIDDPRVNGVVFATTH